MLLRGFGVIALAVGTVLCLVLEAFESYSWLWMLPLLSLGTLVLLVLLAFLYLVLICRVADYEKEQTQDSRHYRKVLETYIESALPALRVRVTTRGLNKIPTDGRFLLVCNHCNDSDPIILLHVLRKFQLAFISKRENSTMFVIGPMMHKLMAQLINRENDREALKTILKDKITALAGNSGVGKSSLVNAVTGQDLSVVSDVAGTTTDPVTKSMELLPLGPVLIIDTPGYDDVGSLGELRVLRG